MKSWPAFGCGEFLVSATRLGIDGGGVEPHPVDRRAFLGADRGVVIEDLQAHGVFAADHLVEDRPRAGIDHLDVLLGERRR